MSTMDCFIVIGPFLTLAFIIMLGVGYYDYTEGRNKWEK